MIPTREELLEKLAEECHNVWVGWTKEVIKLNRNAEITNGLEEKWSPYWIPYSQLPEGTKELDRIPARKIIAVLEKMNIIK